MSRTIRKICGLAALLLSCYAAMATAADPAGEIQNPTPVDLYFLHYFLSQTEPPFRELAKLDPTFKSANEFNRDATLSRLEAELRARAETVKGAKFLRVNLNNAFGEYDTKYNEFDFRVGNGAKVPYSAFGREVSLILTNGGRAENWSLPPSEAEAVIRRTAGDRKVVLLLKLEIINASPAVNSAPLSINARILEYEVMSQRGNLHLGSVVVR